VKRCLAIILLLFGLRVFANEVIPPAPDRYFNDYASVVSAQTASQLNSTLENFERQSSDQILVAIYPTMQSDSSIEDYTVRVARAWKVGQQNKNNGAVLFIFVQDHQMFVEVGYGLEGVLPDALCKRIIDEQISPRFHNGDYDGGCTAGVQGILAAVQGEYKGSGTTVAEQNGFARQHQDDVGSIVKIIFIVVVVFIILSSNRSRRGGGGGFIYTGGGWGGGGGGFSGGGGSFGGGGAGGHW
jgi:uncharacterized protein